MTTELAIEREANLRAQKKMILQLQRLKYLSGKPDITDGNATAAKRDNKQFLFDQGREGNSSDLHVTRETSPAVTCERVDEKLINDLATGDNNEEVSKLEPTETQRYTPVNGSPVSPRRKRQTAKKIHKHLYETETKPDDAKISIVVDNTEPERYTPSFVSSSLEYHRKTSEIRKKADERRRNVVLPSDRYSNNDHLSVYNFQPCRSASLTELHCQHNHDDIDTKRANTSHRSRSKSEEVKVRSHHELADPEFELSPLQRASSMSSIYDSSLSRETEEIKLEGFARKQQERLEDNLRRVEENLDSTFSKLRRYVDATNAILETVKLKDA